MSRMFSLDGKIALVTGAAYGIGFAIARALAKAGAKIAFNGRRANLIADAEKEYASLGINAKGYVFDITNEADVQKFVPQIEKDFGGSIEQGIAEGGGMRQPMVNSCLGGEVGAKPAISVRICL